MVFFNILKTQVYIFIKFFSVFLIIAFMFLKFILGIGINQIYEKIEFI